MLSQNMVSNDVLYGLRPSVSNDPHCENNAAQLEANRCSSRESETGSTQIDHDNSQITKVDIIVFVCTRCGAVHTEKVDHMLLSSDTRRQCRQAWMVFVYQAHA